jgi:hypothetical protein
MCFLPTGEVKLYGVRVEFTPGFIHPSILSAAAPVDPSTPAAITYHQPKDEGENEDEVEEIDFSVEDIFAEEDPMEID